VVSIFDRNSHKAQQFPSSRLSCIHVSAGLAMHTVLQIYGFAATYTELVGRKGGRSAKTQWRKLLAKALLLLRRSFASIMQPTLRTTEALGLHGAVIRQFTYSLRKDGWLKVGKAEKGKFVI
jgi:hypothetical protein